ncbi:MAG: hypothetical protein K2H47_08720 [Muribaculaceae bacterium]|nr:hypothetical protein [Muribaculaceae bacterium]
MKSTNKTNPSGSSKNLMTLKDYYKNSPVFSRRIFIAEICKRCGITVRTAHNWITGKIKPQKQDHYLILSEITGIAPEKLFES